MNARAVAISLALMIIDAGPSQAATIALSTGSSCTYSSISTSSNGDIAVTCASVDTPPTEKPVCTPTATANPVVSGSPTTLNANCTPGPILTYAWNTVPPGSNSISTASSVIVNPTVATTYSVTAHNAAGDSIIAGQVTVTISEAPPPPPPPTGLLTKAEWNRQFSLLNNIPYSTKTAVLSTYEYFKTIYLANPPAYKLPGGTLQTQ